MERKKAAFTHFSASSKQHAMKMLLPAKATIRQWAG
jgi:hypothetical protein